MEVISMNYYDLTVGMFCEESGRDDLLFCYEAVKEDFFNEISGEYLEATKPSQNNNSKKTKIKNFLKTHKKLLKMCAVALVALTALVVAVKAKMNMDSDMKEARQLEKLVDEQRQKYKEYKEKYNLVEKKLSIILKEEELASDEVNNYDKEADDLHIKGIKLMDDYVKAKSENNREKSRELLDQLGKKNAEMDEITDKYTSAMNRKHNASMKAIAINGKKGRIEIEMNSVNRLYMRYAARYNQIAKKYGKFKKMKLLPTSLAEVSD